MIYNSEKHIENINISTYVCSSKSWVDGESRDDSIVVEQLQVADKNHEYHFTYTLLLWLLFDYYLYSCRAAEHLKCLPLMLFCEREMFDTCM